MAATGETQYCQGLWKLTDVGVRADIILIGKAARLVVVVTFQMFFRRRISWIKGRFPVLQWITRNPLTAQPIAMIDIYFNEQDLFTSHPWQVLDTNFTET